MSVRLVTQANSLRVNRAPNTFAVAGNSLEESQYLDAGGARKVKGNAGWMNWTTGILKSQNKPIFWLGNYATSGDRTDQFAAGVTSAIATGASNLLLGNPTNDIGQVYPNSGTVVATSVLNIKTYIKQANDAGLRVFFNWLRGSDAFTSAQIGYMNDINRLLADYFMNGDDFRGPPNVVVLDSTAYAVTTDNASAIVLKNSADGTHDNVAAAKLIGTAFAKKIEPYLREYPGHRLTRLTQSAYGLGTRGLLPNPTLTGTGGTINTGTTGTLPDNISGERTGTATAVFSIEPTDPLADDEGNTWGNQIKVVASGGASGGVVSIVTNFNQTSVVLGDLIKTGWELDVSVGATGLGGVELRTEWYPSTGQTSFPIDMAATGVGTDTGGYGGFVLEPNPLEITTYTGTPYCNSRVAITLSAAGSATIYLRKPFAERA